ncbi:hypothetical protein AHAS_Ahas17G0182100 [Arachis hypogaea]
MKQRLESQVENEEWTYVLEQVKEAKIIEEEEVVEDLGEVEQAASSTIEDNFPLTNDFVDFDEPSSIEIEVDVEIVSALPPSCDMRDGEELE